MFDKLFSLKYLSYFYVFCAIALSNVAASAGRVQIICLGITSLSFVLLFVTYILKKGYNNIQEGLGLLLLLLLFVIYVCISWLMTGYDFSGVTMILMLLSSFIFSSVYEDENDYIGFLITCVIANIVMVALLIYMAGSINNFLAVVSDEELSGLFIQKNIIAFAMSIGSMICLHFILFHNKRLIYISLLTIFVLILFCTGSRRGLISMIVGLCGIYFLYNATKGVNFFKLLLGLLMLYLVLTITLQLDLFLSMNERLNSLLLGINHRDEMSNSDQLRFLMIQKGFNMFLERPILGYGANAFKQIAGFGIYSHNNFVELLANYGIIGFSLFYGFILIIMKKSFHFIIRNNDSFCVFIFAFMCVRLVSDFGNVSYYDKFLYIILGVSISYFQKLKRNEECSF